MKNGNYPLDVGKRPSYFHLGLLFADQDGDGCMHPPDYFRDIAVFLYQEQNGDFVPIGTGFGMVVIEGDAIFWYLITCKHVVKPLLDTGEEVYGRFIQSGGGAVDYGTLKGKWTPHPDPAVDLIVFHSPPEGNRLSATAFDMRSILTKERSLQMGHKVAEGDNVFFLGLFEPYTGAKRNMAIYRFGHVALIPEEPLNVSPFGLSDYNLIEIQAYPFNSGSPLFVELVNVKDGRSAFFLIGVIQGFYPEKQRTRLNAEGDVVVFSHLGISSAIPADKVWELLYQEKLVKERQEKIWAGQRAKGPEPAGGPIIRQEELDPLASQGDVFTREQFEDALRRVSRQTRESSEPDEASSQTSE